MRLASVVMLLSAIALIAADAPPNDDAEALKGNWSAVSFAQGGKLAPADLIMKFKTKFDGKNYTNTIDGQVVEEGSYSIDASKQLKTIDFDIQKARARAKSNSPSSRSKATS